VNESPRSQNGRILILTVCHGATHVQIARVVEKALLQLRPDLQVEIIDALAHCRPLFRRYYDGFEIPMKYWPRLWEHIETRQWRGESTGPLWLFRWGAQPLFRFIESFAPKVVIATEVGLCEMAVLHKRQSRASYSLVGIGALDFERPWAQPEVDLFISSPGEIAGQLKNAGVAPEKIVECGMPVDPSFSPSTNRQELRARLGLERDLRTVLVNFGGSGKMKPRQVVGELRKVSQPFQVVFIARRDENLRAELLRHSQGMAHAHVLPWVDNMHEWMAAADILVSRAGSCTVAEALNCGLPMLVFDAPPGSERRVCELLEKQWQTGCWARRRGEITARLNGLLNGNHELEHMRRNSAQRSHPRAARDAAEAILMLSA
jgi:processive 1,2-diacylglycerol beta-glucosyltransferase